MKPKVQSYMFSYAHSGGFGRMFFSTDGPVTDLQIMKWEVMAAQGLSLDRVCAISVTPIDGEITDPKRWDQ